MADSTIRLASSISSFYREDFELNFPMTKWEEKDKKKEEKLKKNLLNSTHFYRLRR